jgi:DNA-binding transcriptional MerR regulator
MYGLTPQSTKNAGLNMKILELEKKTGLPRDTIRYYEKIGMITLPYRNSSGYREYNTKHINELHFIRRAQEVGFSLKEIKIGLTTFRKTGVFCDELINQLHEKSEFFEERIKKDKLVIKKIKKLLTQFS